MWNSALRKYTAHIKKIGNYFLFFKVISQNSGSLNFQLGEKVKVFPYSGSLLRDSTPEQMQIKLSNTPNLLCSGPKFKFPKKKFLMSY